MGEEGQGEVDQLPQDPSMQSAGGEGVEATAVVQEAGGQDGGGGGRSEEVEEEEPAAPGAEHRREEEDHDEGEPPKQGGGDDSVTAGAPGGGVGVVQPLEMDAGQVATDGEDATNMMRVGEEEVLAKAASAPDEEHVHQGGGQGDQGGQDASSQQRSEGGGGGGELRVDDGEAAVLQSGPASSEPRGGGGGGGGGDDGSDGDGNDDDAANARGEQPLPGGGAQRHGDLEAGGSSAEPGGARGAQDGEDESGHGERSSRGQEGEGKEVDADSAAAAAAARHPPPADSVDHQIPAATPAAEDGVVKNHALHLGQSHGGGLAKDDDDDDDDAQRSRPLRARSGLSDVVSRTGSGRSSARSLHRGEKREDDSAPADAAVRLSVEERATRKAVKGCLDDMVSRMEALVVAGSEDLGADLKRQLREEERKRMAEVKKGQREALQEIFHRLDADGSGSLDYGEVVTGLKSIGIVFNPGDLERMFSVACDPEEETVSLHGLDFILRVLKCSVVPEDPNFASDVDTCIQCLDDQSGGGVGVGGGGGELSEAERTRTKCAAAQGICNLSKHGDEKVVRARQIFMSDLGAIPVLLESLSATKDGNLQFWCAVAATKIVDDNDLSSDAFVDAGGLTSTCKILTSKETTPRTLAAVLGLVVAVCNGSRDARRALLGREGRAMLEIACKVAKECTIPSQEAFNMGVSRPYAPLVSASVDLIASLSCDVRLRDRLREINVARTLADVVMEGGGCAPSSVTPAAVAVAVLVGSGWPRWASPAIQGGVINALMEALRKGTFSSDGGYKSIWMVCMGIAELSGLALNRRELLALGLEEILDTMLGAAAPGGNGIYPPTKAQVLMCMWHLHFDPSPYEIVPKVFGTEHLQDIEQVYWIRPGSIVPAEKVKVIFDPWVVKQNEGMCKEAVKQVVDCSSTPHRTIWRPSELRIFKNVMKYWTMLKTAFNRILAPPRPAMLPSMTTWWGPHTKGGGQVGGLRRGPFMELMRSIEQFGDLSDEDVEIMFDLSLPSPPTFHGWGDEAEVSLGDLRQATITRDQGFLDDLGDSVVFSRYKATLPPGILYQSESPVEQFNIYNDNEDAVDEDGDEDADDVNVGGVDTGEEVLGAVGAQAMSMAEGGSGSLGKKKEKRMVARRQHPWTEGMVARALINGTRRLWPLPNGEQSEILDLGNGLELTLITDKGHVYGVKNAKKLDVSLDVVGWEWSPRGVCVREVNEEPLEGAEDDSEDMLAPGDVWGWTVWQDMGEGGLDEAVQHFVEEDKDRGEWDEDDDWGIESDDEDDTPEMREEKEKNWMLGEAARLMEEGQAATVAEGAILAEEQQLERTFHAIDEDGSGLVDSDELMVALRDMGLAATWFDVQEMQRRIDPEGRVEFLKAEIKVYQDRALLTELGLGEQDTQNLHLLQEELSSLLNQLDLTDDWQFGLRAYKAMIRMERASSVCLPRAAGMRNSTVRKVKRDGSVILQDVPSRPWADYYEQHQARVETLRWIVRAGGCSMGSQSSLMHHMLCAKNALGALGAIGEFPRGQTEVGRQSGFCWLSYCPEDERHAPAVRHALEAQEVLVVDERHTPDFMEYVKRCGTFCAVVTGHYQVSAQCRQEAMLARHLGKTVLFIMAEEFEIVEDWMAHLLGIQPRTPVFVESLPSCVSWMRSSRTVATTFAPPYAPDRRPPVITFTDSFEYCVPSDGTLPAKTLVVLAEDGKGYVPVTDAPPRTISEGVTRREDMVGEVVQGRLVIDFRPAPDLPGLQEALEEAQRELNGPDAELSELRVRLGKDEEALETLKGRIREAKRALEGAEQELEEAQGEAVAAQEALASREEALEAAEEALRTATVDVTEASSLVEEREAAVSEAHSKHEACEVACMDASGRADHFIRVVTSLREEKVALETDIAGLVSKVSSLDEIVVVLRRERDRRQAAVDAEVARSAIQPQTDQAMSDIGEIVQQYKKLKHIGMFLGQATFWKCWVRICIFAGTRVQMKKKLAPYLKRPLWLGFDGLIWWKDIQKERRKKLKKAAEIMYGHAVRTAFNALKAGVKVARDSQGSAVIVLKRFAEMFGARVAGAMLRAWHKRAKLVRQANAMARRRLFEWSIAEWCDGIEEILDLFRKVGIKCAHIVALLTGEQVKNSFFWWKHYAMCRVNSRRAAKRMQDGFMGRIIEWWRDWKNDVRLRQRLVGVGAALFRKLMGGVFGDEKAKETFSAWKLIVTKQKRAKIFWRNGCLIYAWSLWVDGMQDVWAVKNEVRRKCANVVAMISGDMFRACFRSWAEIILKKARALKRWQNSTLTHMWHNWTAYTDLMLNVKGIMARSVASWGELNCKWGFEEWALITDERLYNRALANDAMRMWMNVRVIHAFRSLDEHARDAIHYREVVGNFRRRFEQRPAQRCILAWGGLLADKKRREGIMRAIYFRYVNGYVSRAFQRMWDAVMDKKLGDAEKLAGQSEVLRRMLRRALYALFPLWVGAVERGKYQRQCIAWCDWERGKRLLRDALDRWSNIYIFTSTDDRREELRVACLTALDEGSLKPIQEVLGSHGAWSKPRAWPAMLNGGGPEPVRISELRDADLEESYRLRRRRVRRFLEEKQLGRRPKTRDNRKLDVSDIIDIQQGLSLLLGQTYAFWRAVEAFSVILRMQNMRPPSPLTSSSDEETAPIPRTATAGEGGGRAGGRRGVTAEVPGFIEAPPTPGEEAELEAMSWEEASYFSLYNPRVKATIRQLAPPYLGGRYSQQAVERLHKQVHPLYPIKQFPQWSEFARETQQRENAARMRKQRHAALSVIKRQEEQVALASKKLEEAEDRWEEVMKKIQQLRSDSAKAKAEASRLEDENPFEHKKKIRSLNAMSLALEREAASDEAAAQNLLNERAEAASEAANERGELERLVYKFRSLDRPSSGGKRSINMMGSLDSFSGATSYSGGERGEDDSFQRSASMYEDMVSEGDETGSMNDDDMELDGYSDRGSSVPSRIFTDFSQRDVSVYGAHSHYGAMSLKSSFKAKHTAGAVAQAGGSTKTVTVLPSINDVESGPMGGVGVKQKKTRIGGSLPRIGGALENVRE